MRQIYLWKSERHGTTHRIERSMTGCGRRLVAAGDPRSYGPGDCSRGRRIEVSAETVPTCYFCRSPKERSRS